jgi:hypothetical protein
MLIALLGVDPIVLSLLAAFVFTGATSTPLAVAASREQH